MSVDERPHSPSLCAPLRCAPRRRLDGAAGDESDALVGPSRFVSYRHPHSAVSDRGHMTSSTAYLDPSLHSHNLGDTIIADSIAPIVSSLADSTSLIRLPTQTYWGPGKLRRARGCGALIVGGTNLLTSHMRDYRQWKIRNYEASLLHGRALLLGVGWWQYQATPDKFTATLLKRILADTPHAVRDSYTKQQLESIGVDAINTGCPTMWSLPKRPERTTEMGRSVIFTLTDYLPDVDRDRRLVRLLNGLYRKVILWPQGRRDAVLAAEMGFRGEVLAPTVAAFNAALGREEIDYVGTRLHAGVRALQHGVRSTTLEIDNRAREIGRDSSLPTIRVEDLGRADNILTDSRTVELTLPTGEIQRWRASARAWIAAGL